MARTPLEVTGSFISAINARDLARLRSLMTEDHLYTDPTGARYQGAALMLDNWQYFFYAYPQYTITLNNAVCSHNRIALFGEATGKWRVDGRIQPGSWKVSAAWAAEVDRGQVASWRVYCDTTWMTPPDTREVVTMKPLAIIEA